tara:strand:- start:10574 stop:11365 length:792 start_codon:yes stop_codon:yes gene_type:complete
MWEDSSDDEDLSEFELDLKKLAKDETFESHLDFLGPGLISAAETIQKTRNRMLKEAEKDPSLHLLLYKTSGSKKLLPWWSDVLHRIAIAQSIIEMNLKKKNTKLKVVQEMFPNETEKTLKHILTAIKYTIVQNEENEQEEKRAILSALMADPDTYERLKQWKLQKRQYIYKCIAGFLNANMAVSNQATPDVEIRVAKKGDLYGYFKSGETVLGLENDNAVILLSARDSMCWFAQEVARVLMFDFEWEQAIQWGSYVYKTLTYT